MSYPDFREKENGDELLDFSRFLLYHLTSHHSFVLPELQLHRPLILPESTPATHSIAIIAMVEIVTAKL